MDRPERWDPVSRDPVASAFAIRNALYRPFDPIFGVVCAVGATFFLGAMLRAVLPGPALAVAVPAATVGLAFAVGWLWRTGRARRRVDAVCLVLGWLISLGFLIADLGDGPA